MVEGWSRGAGNGASETPERNIFERGCLRAGEEWVEANLVSVAGAALTLAITQVK